MCGEERGGGIINQSLQPESGTAEQIKDNHPLRSKTETEPMANGLSTPREKIDTILGSKMLYKTRVQDSEITFFGFPEKNLAKPLQFFKLQLQLISPTT